MWSYIRKATETQWKPLLCQRLPLPPCLESSARGGMCVRAKSLQSCLTLCSPMDLPGSSVHGIIQARTLEWVAIFLLQGNFPTQRSNLPLLRLMHWQADSLPRGKPSYGQCTILNAVEDVRMKDTMFLTLSVQPEIHIYATTFRESCNHSDLHPLVSHFTFCFLGVSH